MKEKKVPMRTFLGCMSEKPKKELLRIVKTPEGTFKIDNIGKMNGRGAYSCKNMECIKKICKGKKLGKAFGEQPGQEVYDMILQAAESVLTSDGGGIDGRKEEI